MAPPHTPDWTGSHSDALERARAALLRQDALRPRNSEFGPCKADAEASENRGIIFKRLETQKETKDDG